MQEAWLALSRLGAAGVLLPVAVVVAIDLWRGGQQAAVRAWTTALLPAMVVTLASKVLFFGWGVGSARFDFTGISGHALLAMSILPVLGNWLSLAETRRLCPAGVVVAMTLAAAVGVSRVALGAHSWSEVAAAWAIGAVVSMLALRAMRPSVRRRPWSARLAPLAVLLALATSASSHLPTHAWEVALSLQFSGRQQPYDRHDLNRARQVSNAAG